MKPSSWALYFLLPLVLLACAIACGRSTSSSSSPPAVTWTDSSSGLTWQVTPFANTMDWADATSYCQNLALDGGGWRLPTISELRTAIRGCVQTETGGSCGVTDACPDAGAPCDSASCSGCANGAGPGATCYAPAEFADPCYAAWSSSTAVGDEHSAWYVDFTRGYVAVNAEAASGYGTNFPYVRCVR
jgi:hypothetical protein